MNLKEMKETNRESNLKFIKNISNISLNQILKDLHISKSSFYKGYVSDEEIEYIKNLILSRIFDYE